MKNEREGMAVLLNNVWYIAVVEFRCVCIRFLWVKLKFVRVKVCIVVYSLTQGDNEKREKFWSRFV